MAPWVNDLLYKHEKLTLDPHHPHETQAWWDAPVAIALGQQSQVGVRGSPASLATLGISDGPRSSVSVRWEIVEGTMLPSSLSLCLSGLCVHLCLSLFLSVRLCLPLSLSPSPSSLSHTGEIKEVRFKILKPWLAKERTRQPGIHKVVLDSRHNNNWWL